jgi:hypothetical protein
LQAPAALAFYRAGCEKCAKRIFHNLLYIHCTAKPRERLDESGKDAENQISSKKSLSRKCHWFLIVYWQYERKNL